MAVTYRNPFTGMSDEMFAGLPDPLKANSQSILYPYPQNVDKWKANQPLTVQPFNLVAPYGGRNRMAGAQFNPSQGVPDGQPLYPNAPTPGQVSNLATTAAKQNLEAAPDLTSLSELMNEINNEAQTTANASRLGEAGQATQNILLDNAQRHAQGLLDPATEAMLQSGIAEQGYYTGMGVDSNNLASAYRRALGQTIEQTQAQGAKEYLDLLNANPSAPIYRAETGMVTPEVIQSGQQFQQTLQNKKAEFAAQLGLSYSQLNQQQRQFVDSQAQDWLKYSTSFAESVRQFNQASDLDKEKLAQQMGLSYAQLAAQIRQAEQGNETQRLQIASNLATAIAELNLKSSQFNQSQAQQQGQFETNFAEQVRQFNTRTAQEQANVANQLGLSYSQLQAQINDAWSKNQLAQDKIASDLAQAQAAIEMAKNERFLNQNRYGVSAGAGAGGGGYGYQPVQTGNQYEEPVYNYDMSDYFTDY